VEFLDRPDVLDFLERIRRLTDEGRLEWSKRDDSEYDFVSRTARNAFVVRCVDKDDAHPFQFNIYRRGGEGHAEMIQSLVSSDTDVETTRIVATIYWMVKREVLGVADAVAALFDDLDALEHGDS
jgi:hypothetical protein